MRLATVLFTSTFICCSAVANVGDPPCAPIDPEATEQVDWLRETSNVFLFSDIPNSEFYSTSVIGGCREKYRSKQSNLNCLYVSHENLPKLFEIMERENISIRGIVVNNYDPTVFSTRPFDNSSVGNKALIFERGKIRSPDELYNASIFHFGQ